MTLRDVALRLLGLKSSRRRIERRVARLEASATTGGTASRLRNALRHRCPEGHDLRAHEYALISSIPADHSETIESALAEFSREDWPALQARFGFATGASLDLIALRCPAGAVHAFALLSTNDIYAPDSVLVSKRVEGTRKLDERVRTWDVFDRPRRIETPRAGY